MSAFGNALKDIARNTLLYDSTKMCKGKNSFGNINAKGSSLSNALSAITSVVAGIHIFQLFYRLLYHCWRL